MVHSQSRTSTPFFPHTLIPIPIRINALHRISCRARPGGEGLVVGCMASIPHASEVARHRMKP